MMGLLLFNDGVSRISVILELALIIDELETLTSCLYILMLGLQVSFTIISLWWDGNHNQGFEHAGEAFSQQNCICSHEMRALSDNDLFRAPLSVEYWPFLDYLLIYSVYHNTYYILP